MKSGYIIENGVLIKYCNLILVCNYPSNNIIDNLPIVNIDFIDISKRYVIGVWKNKSLKNNEAKI